MANERGGQFAAVPARALDDRRLKPAAIIVLAVIACYADRDGWTFPLKMSRIAARLEVTRQAVQKQIRSLESAGYLKCEARRKKDGGSDSNKYRLVYDVELPLEFDRNPAKREKLPPSQPEVALPATPEVAPPATSEVAPLPPHIPDQLTPPPPTPSTPKVVEEVEEYIERETDRAADAGEIRTTRQKYAAAVRRKITTEGGRLTPERRQQLTLWQKPPLVSSKAPIIDPHDTYLTRRYAAAYNSTQSERGEK
jgi:DNA-binding Lrp family transcriptional regulator